MTLQSPAQRKGYITLITVLLIGAIASTIVISSLLRGVGETKNSAAIEQSLRARLFADACIEEALQKLRESIYYLGNETLSFADGLCTTHPIAGGGNHNRTIQATGASGTVVRKIEVVVGTIHPIPSISSRQEVAEF